MSTTFHHFEASSQPSPAGLEPVDATRPVASAPISTTAADLPGRARELREQGWRYQDIADELDAPRSTVAQWCCDPDGSKARARKQRYAGVCVDCGAATSGTMSGQQRAVKRCEACSRKHIPESRAERRLIHQVTVEVMWADGCTAREIGEFMGWTCAPGAYISQLRARGYDLPHRRTPEQLARITAGSDQRLAKARAAMRELRGER